MQIFENGTLVGLLNESTLALTKVESPKLKALIDRYKKRGMESLGGATEVIEGVVESDAIVVDKLTTENLGLMRSQLLEEGFETFDDE